MPIETTEYENGTSVTQEFPWGFYIRARVMCPDGISGQHPSCKNPPSRS